MTTNINDLDYLKRFSDLNKHHLTYDDIQPLLVELADNKMLSHRVVGYSLENRPINLFTVGNGETTIFAWSQMHGDEATATASMIDLMGLIVADEKPLTQSLLSSDFLQKVTLHFLPMLNPDGAQAMTRHNAQAIDINRDAIALQSPEGKLLHDLMAELKPDVGFNLHDQSPYYQCGTTGNPATMAFLAPAFDAAKSVDTARHRALALIGNLHTLCSNYIPDKIARYDDTYSARSFGDYAAGQNISTILFEAGAHSDDPNRQIARVLTTLSMIKAIDILCMTNEKQAQVLDQSAIDTYWAIPANNKNKLCSLLIENLTFTSTNNTLRDYKADVSIVQTQRYSNRYVISEAGDLSVLGGLSKFDASSLTFNAGKPYILRNKLVLDDEQYRRILAEGYSHFVGDKELLGIETELAVLFNPHFYHSNSGVKLNAPAYGLFEKEGMIKHAMLNGRILHL